MGFNKSRHDILYWSCVIGLFLPIVLGMHPFGDDNQTWPGNRISQYNNVCMNAHMGVFLCSNDGEVVIQAVSTGRTQPLAQISTFIGEGNMVFWEPKLSNQRRAIEDSTIKHESDFGGMSLLPIMRAEIAFVWAPAAFPNHYCHTIFNNVLPLLRSMLQHDPSRILPRLQWRPGRVFSTSADLILYPGGFMSSTLGPASLAALDFMRIGTLHTFGPDKSHPRIDPPLIGSIHRGDSTPPWSRITCESRSSMSPWIAAGTAPVADSNPWQRQTNATEYQYYYKRVIAGLGGLDAHFTPQYLKSFRQWYSMARTRAKAENDSLAHVLFAKHESHFKQWESYHLGDYVYNFFLEAVTTFYGCQAFRHPTPKRPRVAVIQRTPSKNDPSGLRVIRNLATGERVLRKLQQTGMIEFCGTFYLEKVSLPQQACLFYDVSILIGAHGNALANAVFMEPRSVLIEMAYTGEWWYDEVARVKRLHKLNIASNHIDAHLFENTIISAVALLNENRTV